ncbi:MAG: hypothetical protein Q4E82_03890 [Peptococcaceae bacterium]|nr:hypothetical protein [Peptococcaceae bacterium]
MFTLKKKEKKPLFIKAKDVFSIIKSDYEEGIAFCLIEFQLNSTIYTMGSVLMPNCEEKKENIYFVFEEQHYDTFEAFAEGVSVNGTKLCHADTEIEVLRAGIIDGDAMLKTPWGDTRLAKMAVQR